ncbi:carbohydrate-binding protein [Agaribacterium sp. ZY112]|uniref:carbohydrate-binding protein n=1 Tax=Agaribacterium sp. ZY112 TaxID=3233574 RepID=UPI0035255DC5
MRTPSKFLTALTVSSLLAACGGASSTSPEPSPATSPSPAVEPLPSSSPSSLPSISPSAVPSVSASVSPSPASSDNPNGNFVIQAEDYTATQGDVDTESADGGTVVNFFNSGDVLEFNVNIELAGLYEVTYRVSSPASDAVAELFVTNQAGDGVEHVDTSVVSTGDWAVFEDVVAGQHFNIWSAGPNTIQLRGSGTSDYQFNTNYLSFRRIGDIDVDVDSDADGVPDHTDECPETSLDDEVNSVGCALSQLDGDNDGISNDVDQCPASTEGVNVDANGCEFSGGVIDVNTANPALPSFTTFLDTTPAGKQWQKVEAMSDEFDTWDAAKWFKSTWNYGDTPVKMMHSNSGVTDGYLWIKATLNAGSTQWFETSRVHSRAKILFPMYTESRIQVANISAYSTYWLNNGDANNRDEIDIIEINPTPTCDCQPNYPWQMNSQYFIVKNGDIERAHGNSNNNDLSGANALKGQRWNEDYHVFGAWWKDKNTVQFYLNGEPVNSVTTTQDFTLEQEIIWDLWTQDSTWVGGLPAQDDLLNEANSTMKVDWVRTWQLVDE